MDVHLRSDIITLLSDPELEASQNEVWQLFRRTAVEPGQASSPDFTSFADECLFCAHILVNTPTSAQAKRVNDEESLWDSYTPDGRARPSPPSSSSAITPPNSATRSAGFIYLYAGPANLPAGEASIGVVTSYSMRRHGYAREAVQLVLRWAFEDLKFHRVQAAILDTPFKDRALRLFIGLGFTHEGTKRRAVYQPEGEGMAGVWKDVTHLGMLDTEWMLRSTWKRHDTVPIQPVFTVWDEMFARHSREREELLRWEEDHGRIRRSSSTETLRVIARNATQDITDYLSDDTSSLVEPSLNDSAPSSPEPNVFVTWEEDAHMVDDPSSDDSSQRWEEVIETIFVARQQRQGMGGSLLRPSLQGDMRALPSIPSTRISEGNPQSPVTIPTSSTPGSTPPPSPSSLASPSVYGSWPDFEDEDNWLPRESPLPANVPDQPTTPRHGYDPYPRPGSASLVRRRSRRSSSASSSADSWSDAQSSAGTSSSHWDMISNTSARSHRG